MGLGNSIISLSLSLPTDNKDMATPSPIPVLLNSHSNKYLSYIEQTFEQRI